MVFILHVLKALRMLQFVRLLIFGLVRSISNIAHFSMTVYAANSTVSTISPQLVIGLSIVAVVSSLFEVVLDVAIPLHTRTTVTRYITAGTE